jgi:predicted exporter
VFSAAGLLGAYLSAVCLLPALLKASSCARRNGRCGSRVCWDCVKRCSSACARPVLLALLMPSAPAACCTWTRNDIRQWVGAPPQLTDEAQTMARITGYQPTSQFFLVRGANQQELLERQAA